MSFAIRILQKEKYSQALLGLETDCPLWPYLVHFTRQVQLSWHDNVTGTKHIEEKVVLNGFLSNLTQRLMNAANNVLVAESNVLAKTQHLDKIGRAEFYSCVNENPGYLIDILSSYPELDRLLSTLTANFASSTTEFYSSYLSDKPLLKNFLATEENIHIKKCQVSEGETHKGGRTVVIVTFDNDKKAVFKPRNLTLEASISELLTKLCREAGSPFKEWVIPKYLIRKTHGWAEYTGQKSINNEAQAKSYYKRMGFLLGFCTSFTASDITSDNIIAHGEHPIPIDLETVFYSVLKQSNIPREVRWNASLTSILPNWTWKGTDGIGVDLSAIGGLEEQYVSLNLYQHIADENSDSFGMDGVKIMPNYNVLYLQDQSVKPWHYENEITDGFKQYFALINKQQSMVIAAISDCEGMSSRYVPRATATYHYAIQCSLHPTLMASTRARREFLYKILNSDIPPAVGFLESEIAACMDNDIPYARVKAGNLVFDEPFYGGVGYLEEQTHQNGISHSIDYIKTLTNQRLSFERKLISNTLTAMQSMYEHKTQLLGSSFRANDSLRKLEMYDLNKVKELIRRTLTANCQFTSRAIKKELSETGFWLGFHASSGGHMEYSELGDDFYYGLSGILYGCTVAYRQSLLPKDAAEDLKELCYNRVIEKFENPGSQLGGFHFGLASTVVPLYISLNALNDPRTDALLEHFKKYLTNVLKEDLWQKYFLGSDLMSGVSGCLTVLTKLYELTSDQSLKTLASNLFEKCFSDWIDNNDMLTLRFGKSVTVRQDGLLSGISHGVMGCAYALYYYSFIIENSEKVEKIADILLAWEISQYDERMANWPDYRVRSESEVGEFAWSHGLPGNLLAISYLAENGVAKAKKFISEHPPVHLLDFDSLLMRKRPVNDSLCHGALGVLNIIKQLSPSTMKDHRIYSWANLINFCEQDTRELRIRTADPFGLWVGKVGSILGATGLLDSNYSFPFLPHQMRPLR